jgi:hypothetical protein
MSPSPSSTRTSHSATSKIRGRVELADDPEFVIRDAIARKHGFPDGGAFDEPGSHRVTMTIVPTRVIEH